MEKAVFWYTFQYKIKIEYITVFPVFPVWNGHSDSA